MKCWEFNYECEIIYCGNIKNEFYYESSVRSKEEELLVWSNGFNRVIFLHLQTFSLQNTSLAVTNGIFYKRKLIKQILHEMHFKWSDIPCIKTVM